MNSFETVARWNDRAPASRRRINRPGPKTLTDQATSGATSSAQLKWTVEPSVTIPDYDEEGLTSNNGLAERQTPIGARKTRRRRTNERFWLLNKWQGQVLKINQDTFEAQLQDLAHPNTVERAELLISDLPDDGRALLRPGAVFYWMIGYLDDGSRQRRRQSVIWMRRSGAIGLEKFHATLDAVNQTWAAFDESTEPAPGS